MGTFYVVAAGAAATLLGLLFVAVQLGQTSHRGPRRAMARSTFSLFVLIFALSLYSLVPSATSVLRAWLVLAVSIGGAVRATTTWLPVWRAEIRERVSWRLWQTAWLLLAPVLAYAYLVLIAVAQLRQPSGAALDEGIGGAFVILFVIGLRNAWGLLVEATDQTERQA